MKVQKTKSPPECSGGLWYCQSTKEETISSLQTS